MSSNNVNITSLIVASCLIEYCHIVNFSFLVLILKYLKIKNYSSNVVDNCES